MIARCPWRANLSFSVLAEAFLCRVLLNTADHMLHNAFPGLKSETATTKLGDCVMSILSC